VGIKIPGSPSINSGQAPGPFDELRASCSTLLKMKLMSTFTPDVNAYPLKFNSYFIDNIMREIKHKALYYGNGN
jgi:hypothetical protein